MFQSVSLVKKMAVKSVVVFLPIFVVDTKIIFRYNFVAPLKLTAPLYYTGM